jgi:hypothetical protein
VVLDLLTKDEIVEELLKVMTSPWTFLDITGVECALPYASIDRLDPQGDHTLANSPVVFRGINLLRSNCPDDRYVVEALKRWKSLPFSGLLKSNLESCEQESRQQHSCLPSCRGEVTDANGDQEDDRSNGAVGSSTLPTHTSTLSQHYLNTTSLYRYNLPAVRQLMIYNVGDVRSRFSARSHRARAEASPIGGERRVA